MHDLREGSGFGSDPFCLGCGWVRFAVTTKMEAVRVERFQRFGRVDLFGILPLRQAQGQNDSKNKGKRWTKLKVYE